MMYAINNTKQAAPKTIPVITNAFLSVLSKPLSVDELFSLLFVSEALCAGTSKGEQMLLVQILLKQSSLMQQGSLPAPISQTDPLQIPEAHCRLIKQLLPADNLHSLLMQHPEAHGVTLLQNAGHCETLTFDVGPGTQVLFATLQTQEHCGRLFLQSSSRQQPVVLSKL